MIVESLSESRRFGLKVGRIEAGDIDGSALQAAVISGCWDWLVLRLDCGRENSIEGLRLLGLEPQQTDTLMTWSIALNECDVARPALAIESAQPEDAPAISDLVRQVFERYPNHYTANPLLDSRRAIEGYVEWALSHIEHPQRLCWVVRGRQGIAALSCSHHDSAGLASGVLHGVHPEHAGGGLYRGLIEASLAHYRAAGCSRFSISTQAGNHTVQNLWARLGFRIERSRATVHLMPLLGRTLAQPAHALAGAARANPLRALQEFASAQREATMVAVRSGLHVDPAANLSRAARLRGLHWPCGPDRLRQMAMLTDINDRPLAWLHADLLPTLAD